MNNINYIFIILLFYIIIQIIGIYNIQNNYKIMKNIIEEKGDLHNDPYNRKLSSKVIKKFCKISNKLNINLLNITDKQFDDIYKTYVEYQLKKYDNL